MCTNKYDVVTFLYKGVVEFLDGSAVTCLDDCVVALLDNNTKDYYYVDIRHSLDDCFEVFSLHNPWNSFLKNLG